MKRALFALLAVAYALTLRAEEGMWPVERLPQSILQKLQKSGASGLLDGKSLKKQKAVVIFGGGCTGAFISADGLIITNHHCASGDLEKLSTEAKNLLRDGYIATSKQEEIPVPGLSIKILEDTKDITREADSLKEVLSGSNAMLISRRITYLMQKKYFPKSQYELDIKTDARSGRTTLYAYTTIEDVRLVAAPPMQSGRFGGNGDNFEWKRYQLDFAVFRAYTNSDSTEKRYSAANLPFSPSQWFTMSKKKISNGLATYTIGYPGATNRGLSAEVMKTFYATPDSITTQVRNEYLSHYPDPMPLETARDRAECERIFSYANVAKFSEGRYAGFNTLSIYQMMKNRELQLPQEERILLEKQGQMAIAIRPISSTHTTVVETMFRGGSLLTPGMRSRGLLQSWDDSTARAKAIGNLSKWFVGYFPNLNMEQEQQHLYGQMKHLQSAPLLSQRPVLQHLLSVSDADLRAFAERIVKESIFTSEQRFKEFTQKGTKEQLAADPIYILANEAYDFAIDLKKQAAPWQDSLKQVNLQLRKLKDKQAGESYPEANFTMRLSLGSVEPYVSYKAEKMPATTTFGDMLAADGKKSTYQVEPALAAAIKSQKPLAKQTLCFTTSNDITSGNSGSPVLDADGQIVGLAFDGNYESLLGDICYLPKYNRAVCVSFKAIVDYLSVKAPQAYFLQELK